MMSCLRNTPFADKTMHEGKVGERMLLTGLRTYGRKKVGIVGFGRIGQIVAKRISGFRTRNSISSIQSVETCDI